MLVTIAICTWNRAALLDQTLSAMEKLSIPIGVDWEVIVVNNNCTDQTDAIIAKHSDSLPLLRIFESKQGLSNARNSAVAAARGEYILWTDDDVIVSSDWVQAYLDAFYLYPEAVFFGGSVDPWFEGQPPSWIVGGWDIISDAYAARNLGADPFMFDTHRLPYGANFAVRSKEQKVFLYDTNLGLVQSKIILGEESQLFNTILRAGGTGWWVPGAKVRHWIPATRQHLDFIRRYYMGYGRTLRRKNGIPSSAWHSKPRWLWRKALQAELMYRLKRFTSHAEDWLLYLKLSSQYWGEIFD